MAVRRVTCLLGAGTLLYLVGIATAADITNADNITLPTKMFRIEKEEVGYYGTLKAKYRDVPIR
jgi:hypothetical protein